jgi:hypothetical protein
MPAQVLLPAYRHQKPDCVKRGAAAGPSFALELAGLASHKGKGLETQNNKTGEN